MPSVPQPPIRNGRRALMCAGLAGLLLLAPLAVAAAPAGQTNQTCQMQDFEATVNYGPDAGLSLAGVLTLQIAPSGDTQGMLVRGDGTQVAAVGQVNGRAINLAFDVGGSRLVGVGTADADIRACRGAIGGPLTGPQPGDLGDWGYAIGG